LKNNLKEQNENVMIVDLVRNDLSKVADSQSVKVEELFEVYSFKQVHQLISTITCSVSKNYSITNILKANFPMGSMTGAPKESAMKLIEEFEMTKRGIYSGTIGYIEPNGNFDFNVVIRSLVYNSENKNLSYSVGSAITSLANANEEYDECLLKAKIIQDLFKKTI
jgi:para-aminobenzoate synthetase component 1